VCSFRPISRAPPWISIYRIIIWATGAHGNLLFPAYRPRTPDNTNGHWARDNGGRGSGQVTLVNRSDSLYSSRCTRVLVFKCSTSVTFRPITVRRTSVTCSRFSLFPLLYSNAVSPVHKTRSVSSPWHMSKVLTTRLSVFLANRSILKRFDK